MYTMALSQYSHKGGFRKIIDLPRYIQYRIMASANGVLDIVKHRGTVARRLRIVAKSDSLHGEGKNGVSLHKEEKLTKNDKKRLKPLPVDE